MTLLLNPGRHWERTDTSGWKADLLAGAEAYARRIGSSAVMIVQRGRVIAEWGDTARKCPIASVRKSLLSALYGIAIEEGKININATLAEFGIDDKQPLTAEEKQATVANLLMSCSGVYHPVDSQPVDLAGPLPARGSHRPGTHFYYNNWDFNALGTIFEQQTGEGIYESFKRRIAEPIGMEDFAVSDGVWGSRHISNHRNYGFVMSARDLARFGMLYARYGRWNDRKIVPMTWVHSSTTLCIPVHSKAFAGGGYGFMWWTHFGGLTLSPSVPQSVFFAYGIGAQYIFVYPPHGLVIVHTVDMARETWPDVSNMQITHLVWLVLTAAGVPDIGPEPPDP